MIGTIWVRTCGTFSRRLRAENRWLRMRCSETMRRLPATWRMNRTSARSRFPGTKARGRFGIEARHLENARADGLHFSQADTAVGSGELDGRAACADLALQVMLVESALGGHFEFGSDGGVVGVGGEVRADPAGHV